MTYSITLRPGECFFGGSVADSLQMPFDTHSSITCDLRGAYNRNQTMPLLLSNKGRYIWSEVPFVFTFQSGVLTIEGDGVTVTEAGKTLRDAYRSAMQAHFPFDGRHLCDTFFRKEQFNSWMQFMYNPTQAGILDYAHKILHHGFEPGILIIDEGWQSDYGTWTFDPHKFPDPVAMCAQLHSMGFKIMLWIVPYVSCSGYQFQQYTRFHPDSKALFMRNEDGEISIVRWWNGYSAILDFTKACDCRFLDEQLKALTEDYGIDGFKFDGGSYGTYLNSSIVNGNRSAEVTAEMLNSAWNAFGRKYAYHEYKDSYRQGGKNMIQRLCDRLHSWGDNGIASLVASSTVQGLLGTPFICPDMIGGGEWSSFKFEQNCVVDEELFVRMAQCSALLPMMQFSLAPWEVLGEENLKAVVSAAKLHGAFADYIVELVRASETNGEPIVRHLEYEYPDSGFAYCKDCFMLGSRYLVAPVLQKGARERTLVLPEGRWRYVDGTVCEGGTVTVAADIDTLPFFEKMDA